MEQGASSPTNPPSLTTVLLQPQPQPQRPSLSDGGAPGTGGSRAQSPGALQVTPLAGFGRNYSADTHGSQQPGVAVETAKECGVALATDEMRGYPDKKATGTHLAGPRCAFSDR